MGTTVGQIQSSRLSVSSMGQVQNTPDPIFSHNATKKVNKILFAHEIPASIKFVT